MTSKSRPYPLKSIRCTVDENGISINSVLQPNGVIPWPESSTNVLFPLIEIAIVAGSDLHLRTGDSTLTNAEVKRFSDVPIDTASDRFFYKLTVVPNVGRFQPSKHTHLAMRTEAGMSATVIINPGTTS